MIQHRFPLGFQWSTQEPFLFCVHHLDKFPKGNGQFGPDSKYLKGRNIGQDFEVKDGFRMYHGDLVPGFPSHPHRGFETITIVRKGYVDHADSMGAAGRYGEGDVQWMTAGKGVQHSEMFPLLRTDKENTLELFQIWLNLPRKKKMTEPYFTMLWSEQIPKIRIDEGRVEVTLISGEFQGKKALPPPPESWANDPQGEVAVWLFRMQKGGEVLLPQASDGVARTLYFFEGNSLQIAGENLNPSQGAVLNAGEETLIKALEGEVQFLVLQARPLGEPVFQHGPFVMNSREEIIQTIQEYQETEFGGWPWDRDDMVHGGEIERFAKHPDGRLEKP